MAKPILTLAETKQWLRIDGDEEDALVQALIADATELIEMRLRRPVIGTAEENAVCAKAEDVPYSVRLAALAVIALRFENRDATSADVAARLTTNAGLDRYIVWEA